MAQRMIQGSARWNRPGQGKDNQTTQAVNPYRPRPLFSTRTLGFSNLGFRQDFLHRPVLRR
jgi:hypothetical protein